LPSSHGMVRAGSDSSLTLDLAMHWRGHQTAGGSPTTRCRGAAEGEESTSSARLEAARRRSPRAAMGAGSAGCRVSPGAVPRRPPTPWIISLASPVWQSSSMLRSASSQVCSRKPSVQAEAPARGPGLVACRLPSRWSLCFEYQYSQRAVTLPMPCGRDWRRHSGAASANGPPPTRRAELTWPRRRSRGSRRI
jgi:hypothetical protein